MDFTQRNLRGVLNPQFSTRRSNFVSVLLNKKILRRHFIWNFSKQRRIPGRMSQHHSKFQLRNVNGEKFKMSNVLLSISADQTRRKIHSFGSSSSRIAQINRVGEKETNFSRLSHRIRRGKSLPNERCERRRVETSRGNPLKIPFVPRCHWLQIPSFICHPIILFYSFESLLIEIEMSLSSSFWNFECSSSRKCNEKKK